MGADFPKINSWVEYLEMRNNPVLNDGDIDLGNLSIQLKTDLSADDYLALYKEVGRHYIWNYRPSQSKEKVQEIVSSESTQIYYFYNDADEIGFSEIDASNPKDIEIVHFGLVQECLGQGFGKELFKAILQKLWSTSPDRVHLSTCGLDHEKAVRFYTAAGFEIYKTKENVAFEDYRYSDFYDMNDAPQIPLAGEGA